MRPIHDTHLDVDASVALTDCRVVPRGKQSLYGNYFMDLKGGSVPPQSKTKAFSAQVWKMQEAQSDGGWTQTEKVK